MSITIPVFISLRPILSAIALPPDTLPSDFEVPMASSEAVFVGTVPFAAIPRVGDMFTVAVNDADDEDICVEIDRVTWTMFDPENEEGLESDAYVPVIHVRPLRMHVNTANSIVEYLGRIGFRPVCGPETTFALAMLDIASERAEAGVKPDWNQEGEEETKMGFLITQEDVISHMVAVAERYFPEEAAEAKAVADAAFAAAAAKATDEPADAPV